MTVMEILIGQAPKEGSKKIRSEILLNWLSYTMNFKHLIVILKRTLRSSFSLQTIFSGFQTVRESPPKRTRSKG